MLEADFTDFEQMIDDVYAAIEITKADLDECADLLVHRIIDRTRRGEDIYGMPFDAYAEKTKQSKRKRAHRTSPVTLQDTGRMLASMRGRSDGDVALVYFASRTEGQKAAWLDEGTRHMPERRFMDATPADLDACADMLLDRIIRRL